MLHGWMGSSRTPCVISQDILQSCRHFSSSSLTSERGALQDVKRLSVKSSEHVSATAIWPYCCKCASPQHPLGPLTFLRVLEHLSASALAAYGLHCRNARINHLCYWQVPKGRIIPWAEMSGGAYLSCFESSMLNK